MRKTPEASDGVVVLVRVAWDGLEVLREGRHVPWWTDQTMRLCQIDMKSICVNVLGVGEGKRDKEPFDGDVHVVLVRTMERT